MWHSLCPSKKFGSISAIASEEFDSKSRLPIKKSRPNWFFQKLWMKNWFLTSPNSKIYLVCWSGVFDAWFDADGTFDSFKTGFYDPRIYGSRLPLCFLWYFGGRTRFSFHSSTKGHICFSRRTACEVWLSELFNTMFNKIGVFSVEKTFTGSGVIRSNKWVCIRSNKGGSIRSLFFSEL